MSLALGDKGDASAASAKAALALQHAETLALREGETAEAARGVLNEVGGAALLSSCVLLVVLFLLVMSLMLSSLHAHIVPCLLFPDLCTRIRPLP